MSYIRHFFIYKSRSIWYALVEIGVKSSEIVRDVYMKLSTKGRYGVAVVYDLAKHYGSGPVAVRMIASRQQISEHYLEQLMRKLRSAGFVKSIRGAQGGYTLGRSPAEISVGEVVHVMEGEFAPVHCLHSDWLEERNCMLGTCTCVTRGVWKEVRDSFCKLLSSISFQDLCDENVPAFRMIKE